MLFALSAGQVHAQNSDQSIYLVPSVAYHFLDDKGNIDDTPTLGINLGYQWHENLAVELGARVGSTETAFGDDADMLSLQIDGLFHFQEYGHWQPYIVASVKELSFEVDKRRSETTSGIGAGSYYRLTDNIRLRGDARSVYSYTDDLIDTELTLGVQFLFGGKKTTASTPPPPPKKQVVVAPKPHLYTFAVHFKTESAVLLPEYAEHVEDLFTVLKHNPKSSIVIEGDTDNTGSDVFNLHLSQERAESVKAMLVDKHGIHADRIVIDAEGEKHPIADNATAEGRTQNRRAVVKVRVIHE
jgi:outer membrane protein OmpA-like peptidoglycan-associated protein